MFKEAAVTYLFLFRILPLNTSNVYDYLWRHYGASIMNHFGACVKTHLKLNKLKHDMTFIRICKREKLMPNFTKIRLANPFLNGSKLIQQCSFNILQAELKFKKQIFTQTYRHSVRLDNALKELVPHLIYIRLQTIKKRIINKRMVVVKRIQESKLGRLKHNNIKQPAILPLNIKSVTNLSSRTLTIDETNALANGLHHVYPSGLFDEATFATNIEYFYAKLLNIKTTYRHYEHKKLNEPVAHQLTPAQLDIACQIRSISNMIKYKAQAELKTLGSQHKSSIEVLKNLAKDGSIVITKPDKGRGVVILNRTEYIEKMETILNDPLAFKTIDYDPTIENENHLTRLLLELKKEQFITEKEYYLAKPTGSRPARIYGLPKLHKPNHPLRPVMSATKTVAYGLGKVLINRLSHLRNSPYVVKDSFDFVKKINSSEHADKVMVSFDVISLFTNIPLKYTLNLILNQLYPACEITCLEENNDNEDKKKKKGIKEICIKCDKRYKFKTLLRIATSKVNFLFNNKMYVQHDGVAMGAPLAPVIADIFMTHLETTLMEQLKKDGIIEWHRYVDDTFVLIDPKTNIQDILTILNNFHDSIKFTYEMEKNNTLPFLDIRVHRIPGQDKFSTTVYRKKTYTGLMINWFSFVPMNYKKACIINMIKRAISICSTYRSLASELDHIRKIALANSYPRSFIEERIGIGLNNYIQNRTNNTTTQTIGCHKQKMYFELPFLGKTTDILKKNLKRILNKCRPEIDAHFYTRSPTTIQHFFKVKDSINKFMQSDIIYSIKCYDCDKNYIGKTERQMIRRMIEHGAPKQLLEQAIRNEQQKNISFTTINTVDHRNNSVVSFNNKDKTDIYPNDKMHCNSTIIINNNEQAICTSSINKSNVQTTSNNDDKATLVTDLYIDPAMNKTNSYKLTCNNNNNDKMLTAATDSSDTKNTNLSNTNYTQNDLITNKTNDSNISSTIRCTLILSHNKLNNTLFQSKNRSNNEYDTLQFQKQVKFNGTSCHHPSTVNNDQSVVTLLNIYDRLIMNENTQYDKLDRQMINNYSLNQSSTYTSIQEYDKKVVNFFPVNKRSDNEINTTNYRQCDLNIDHRKVNTTYDISKKVNKHNIGTDRDEEQMNDPENMRIGRSENDKSSNSLNDNDYTSHLTTNIREQSNKRLQTKQNNTVALKNKLYQCNSNILVGRKQNDTCDSIMKLNEASTKGLTTKQTKMDNTKREREMKNQLNNEVVQNIQTAKMGKLIKPDSDYNNTNSQTTTTTTSTNESGKDVEIIGTKLVNTNPSQEAINSNMNKLNINRPVTRSMTRNSKLRITKSQLTNELKVKSTDNDELNKTIMLDNNNKTVYDNDTILVNLADNKLLPETLSQDKNSIIYNKHNNTNIVSTNSEGLINEKNGNESAILKHQREMNHKVDWNASQVV